MPGAGLAVLDRNIAQTNERLNEVAEVIGGSRQQANLASANGLSPIRHPSPPPRPATNGRPT
jgi:hypothetical protein